MKSYPKLMLKREASWLLDSKLISPSQVRSVQMDLRVDPSWKCDFTDFEDNVAYSSHFEHPVLIFHSLQSNQLKCTHQNQNNKLIWILNSLVISKIKIKWFFLNIEPISCIIRTTSGFKIRLEEYKLAKEQSCNIILDLELHGGLFHSDD